MWRHWNDGNWIWGIIPKPLSISAIFQVGELLKFSQTICVGNPIQRKRYRMNPIHTRYVPNGGSMINCLICGWLIIQYSIYIYILYSLYIHYTLYIYICIYVFNYFYHQSPWIPAGRIPCGSCSAWETASAEAPWPGASPGASRASGRRL